MGDFVIVGSGVAGHSAAAEIHKLAPDRTVKVIGAEPGLPYDRPPLSKDYLLADMPVAPVFGSSKIYGGGVVLRDGQAAIGIDPAGRTVLLSDGARLPYERLLLATGSRLRHLAFAPCDAARIFYLRTLADAGRLRQALTESSRVAVIGGGFIGLEVAAAARRRGCSVVVLERAPELLSRAASPFLGGCTRAMHAGRGVEMVLDARIDGIDADASGVTIACAAGSVRADIAVVGVGVVPNVEMAEQAGLATADGIVVDAAGRSSDAAIYAAGEVTNYPISRLGRRARTESWSSASAQAVVAARNMVGGNAVFDELPWFWSDQYDVSIQCLGFIGQAVRCVRVGEAGMDRWLRIGLDHAGRLVGAEAFNMGREMSMLRRADRNDQPVPTSLLDLACAEAADAEAEPVLADVAQSSPGRDVHL